MVQCLKDGTFDLQALEKTIDKSTVLIVGSAPSYNLGIIDPIEELSDFCLNKEIPLHVDCCLGAFLINFTDLKFDFRLFGVTSISADLHKYGNTPKGASTVLYRNKDIMRGQYFIDENWSGGVYATTTIAGSKCGNIIALSWATLMYNGINQYKNNYQKIMEVREYFVEKLEDVKEIIIYGKPELNVVAMGSKDINMNILGEKLKDKGWDINMIQNPGGFHFCVTSYHTKEVVDEFFADLNELVPEIPHSTTDSKCIYGTMKSLNDNEIIQDVITEYLHILNSPI
jgi:sphinganine-1-phosphate aldolase